MDIIRTFACSGQYGLVGTDWVRFHMVRLSDLSVVLVFANTNIPLAELPSTYRTSGDIANAMPKLGHRVNAAAVPSVALPNHAWKTTFTLDEIGHKFGINDDVLNELRASYADVEELAA